MLYLNSLRRRQPAILFKYIRCELYDMIHVGQTTASQVNKHIGALIGEMQSNKAELTMYADGISAELKDIKTIMRDIYKGDSVDSYIDRMVDNGMVERLGECRDCIETCIEILTRMNDYVDAMQDYF